MWRGKRPRIVKTMLKQKSKIRILTPFQLQDLVYSSRNQDSVVLAKRADKSMEWNRKPKNRFPNKLSTDL